MHSTSCQLPSLFVVSIIAHIRFICVTLNVGQFKVKIENGQN